MASHNRSLICLLLFVCLLPVEVARAATLPAGFSETLVAGEVHAPSAMQFAPDGRLFVCRQTGVIRVVKDGVLLPTPFATLGVHYDGERGLLGIAFDPQFATNGFVYVYYTVPPRTNPAAAAHNRISRLTADGDVMVPDSELVLMELDDLSTSTIHNGGAMDFGADGKLYIATGENARSPLAQRFDSRLGKILRINKDGSIPTDNPHYLDDRAQGDNKAIWARGLRNPFTFAFDRRRTLMYINDVGAEQWEEINHGRPGKNYGWPTTEGPFEPSSFPSFINPVYAYPHVNAGDCAITGGAFYTPQRFQFPASYDGDYFFADYCSGTIRRFDPETGGEPLDFASGLRAPVDLKVGPDGSLYYLVRNSHGGDGEVWRITYDPDAPSITTHPANLSVIVGQPATFTVTAAGEPPLTYRWQRNGVDIPGAAGEGSSYTIAAATLADNGAKFRVRVENGGGDALSNEATLTVTTVANDPPTAVITQPTAGTTYNGGSVIIYAGTGTDPQEGTLPASAFTWRIDFHHDSHLHPFMPETGGAMGGTVTIPTIGETSANVWYRIRLTVRDGGGFSHTVQRDIVPNKVRVTLATSPPGLQVNLDGQPRETPVSFDAVVGVMRNLSAPSPQVAGNTTYEIVSWSDGGYAEHDASTPGADITYTATFQPVSATGPPPAPVVNTYTNGLTLGLSWTPAPGATSYVLEAGSAPGAADLLNTNIGDVTALQGVIPAGTYFARIRSVGPGGVSAPSNEVTILAVGSGPCAAPPPVPAGYTAQAADLHVQLSWDPSPSAASYVLEAGSSSGQADLFNANVGNTTSLGATASAGLYFTRVRAINACGVSEPSAEVPVTLGCSGAPPLSGLTFTKVNGIVTLSWTRSPGAASYRMQVGTAPGLADALDASFGSATSQAVNVGGMSPATFFVRIFAVNACGTSEASNEVVVQVP